jgi:argininosuccinate lyase
MSIKLWQKADAAIDARAEQYTAGDVGLDQRLVKADVLGSIAHARMLQKIGILTADEFAALRAELVDILRLDAAGRFVLTVQDEDVHTRVENHLVAALGDPGKKIHTARSRNDQVALDMRLFIKESLLGVEGGLLDAVDAFLGFARRYEWTPMPGYTHMQRAMLSSVGLWVASFAESLLDDRALLGAVYDIVDQSPLGSAASYGVPLPIDRQYAAELLGFARVHNNVLAAQHGRGKHEGMVVQALGQVMLDLSRFAQDVVLFTTSEYGFFTLDQSLCTGSSIMPQKRNADILELARGQASVVQGLAQQIMATITGLPSGYNADVSLTKRPVMQAFDITLGTLGICALAARSLTPNEAALRAALSPEVFATDAAYDLVAQGVPFRDAYRRVAADLASLAPVDPEPALKERTHQGASGNLGLGQIVTHLESARADLAERTERFQAPLQALVDGAIA